MPTDIDGILLFDKPLGLSSAQAVARIKRLFGARKAGHTGSLDPLACGMLPICLGEATKFGAQLLEADKEYRVTARLGQRTPSADRETPVVESRKLPAWSAQDLHDALVSFPREYAQIPPMHSALKQDGRPLYEYARAGITRPREARPIVLRELRLLDWQCPDLSFDVLCSKGTYVRVLVEEIAAALGTVGHLSSLRRSSVAPFSHESVWTLAALEAMTYSERIATLLPVDAALRDWRRLDLPVERVGAFQQGQTVSIPEAVPGRVRIYAAGAAAGCGFLGLASVEPAGRLVPLRLIAAAANRA